MNTKLTSQAERLKASDAANGNMLEEIKRLNAQVSTLTEGLRFYLKRNHWTTNEQDRGNFTVLTAKHAGKPPHGWSVAADALERSNV